SLYTRATTGRAPAVSVSLFEALGEWLGAPAYYTQYGGEQPPRSDARHATIAPYGPFAVRDGTVLLGVQTQRGWVALCALIGAPELAGDPRFATNPERVANRVELETLLGARLATVDSAALDRAG